MSTMEVSQDLNQNLIDKVRSGKSPTPKDRRNTSPYGYKKSNEEAKIRIQKDILDSLKESGGIPALVYPQDYIFDIAHLRASGNLGELIDDMSNIANAEEKFEMVKSENKILRERLHNALQREMKAIKTFQKLANDNRLLHLRLKEYENISKAKMEEDSNSNEPFTAMNGSIYSSRIFNGGHRKHNQLVFDETKAKDIANKSTSTSDLRESTHEKSTSTDELCQNELVSQKMSHGENNAQSVDSKEADSCKVRCDSIVSLSLRQRRDLFKTKSSPNILADFSGLDSLCGRVRSASLGSQGENDKNNDLNNICKCASSGAINGHAGMPSSVTFRKLSEKRVCSFPSSLDVVNEETDTRQNKQNNSPETDRSSLSSEGNFSLTYSVSSDLENNSPCLTPSSEKAFSEKGYFPQNDSLHALHMYSRSLPATLNRRQAQSGTNADGGANDLMDENEKQPFPKIPRIRRSQTADNMTFKKIDYSSGSTISLPTGGLKDNCEPVSRKKRGKKKMEKESSSDESEKEENISNPHLRRRGAYIANNADDFVADIKKFQRMLSAGQITLPSHESDNEEDILQTCEAVRNQRYSCRRGSAVVQIPASSVQMDLHVATQEPLGTDSRKKQFGTLLSLEDKRSSRWSSILKTRKKLLLQKDKLRISEDLKEYLSTKTRPAHVSSETELSFYRDTHWTHLMKVTDKTGYSRPLCDSDSNSLPEKEMKRREAVWELFHSEVVYLTAHLLVLKECFLEPLREIQDKGFLVSIDDKKIFSNLEDLCEVSAKFAKDLLHLFKNEQENQFGSTASVVTAFTKFKWTVHPQYERYCLSYTSILNYLESLKRMEEAQQFFKWCEKDPRCNRLKLTDLLVAPFQHLTKYPLLLKNIRKRTSEGDRQHAPLTSTIKSVEILIQELEGNVTVVRNYQKVKELQKNLVWPSVGELDPKSYIPELIKGLVSHQECRDILASPKRQLIFEGPLTLHESTKIDVIVFLFDDMLLLTKGTKKTNRHLRKISMGSGQYGGSLQESLGVASPVLPRKASDYTYSVWKQPLPIDRFVLHDLDDYQGNSIKNGFVLVHMSRFKQAIAIHTLQASSKDFKDTWISKLRETQSKWSEMMEQEISEERNENSTKDEKTDKNIREVKTDSDSVSEVESGTISESNSGNDEDHVFDEDDMEIQTTTTSEEQTSSATHSNNDTNNNSSDNLPSNKNSRVDTRQKKSSRIVSAI